MFEIPEGERPTAVVVAVQLPGVTEDDLGSSIAELERLRAGLTRCIGCGCLSLQLCQLANPEDTVGRAGPGPRFWMARDRATRSRQ